MAIPVVDLSEFSGTARQKAAFVSALAAPMKKWVSSP